MIALQDGIEKNDTEQNDTQQTNIQYNNSEQYVIDLSNCVSSHSIELTDNQQKLICHILINKVLLFWMSLILSCDFLYLYRYENI